MMVTALALGTTSGSTLRYGISYSRASGYSQRSTQRFVCGTNMSSKCIKISSCLCFIIFSVGLFLISGLFHYNTELDFNHWHSRKKPSGVLTFSEVQSDLKFNLHDLSSIKTPSLESLVRASSTEEDQKLHVRGLAEYSNLTNACQPPVDVSKSNIHVNKIALITFANETVCPLPEVAVNAQNAGYNTAVIHLTDFAVYSSTSETQTDTQDKLLIPVLSVNRCANVIPDKTEYSIWSPYIRYHESSFV